MLSLVNRNDMDELGSTIVQCPYCGESVEILVESDLEGEMVWDCEVCCRPWSVEIVDTHGFREIRVHTLDD